MVYFFLAVYLFILTFVYANTKDERYKSVLYYLASIPVFFLFSFRDISIGGDTVFYVEEFAANAYRERELGYVLFLDVISIFGRYPFVYIFFTSAISILPFLLLVRQQSKNNPLSLLYLFCFSVLIICIETNIRQNIGTGLLLLGYFFLLKYEKYAKRYLLLSFLLLIWGTLCHASLYFMTPFCVGLYYLKLSKKISYIIICLSFFVGIFSSGFVKDFLDLFFIYTEGVEGLEKLNSYSDGTMLGTFSESSPIVSCLLVTFWSFLILSSIEKEEINNFFIKCLVAYVVIYNVASISDLMYRLVYTLQLSSLVFVPQKMMKSHRLIILFLFLLIWLRALFFLCSDSSAQNPDACMFPYKTIF